MDFFIIGTQRSGTTLLRLILNSHSKICIPEEATFLMPFMNKKILSFNRALDDSRKEKIKKYLLNNYQFKKWHINETDLDNLLKTELNYSELISEIYNLYARNEKKEIVGDKTPPFIRRLNIINQNYPNSKFIYIIRDGRDTYLSLKAKKHYSAKSITIKSLEWRIKNHCIEKHLQKCHDKKFLIRYEDLITYPKKKVKEICTFLKVNFEDNMLDYWKNSDLYIDKEHSYKINSPVDPNNKFKWKKNISKNDLLKYQFFSKNFLLKHNYETIKYSYSFIDIVLIYKDVIFFLPIRILHILRVSLFMKFAAKFGLKVGKRYYK